jgi:hypothetical protein
VRAGVDLSQTPNQDAQRNAVMMTTWRSPSRLREALCPKSRQGADLAGPSINVTIMKVRLWVMPGWPSSRPWGEPAGNLYRLR